MNISFLWHFHQPDYRRANHFFLPWVRLHGSKDYFDFPTLIANSGVRQTINVVPSLLDQLNAYSNGILDPIQRLCAIDHHRRSQAQITELAQWICTLQYKTMVEPFPRLTKLWDSLQRVASGSNVHLLTEEDFTDAEVLFHLAWLGPFSRKRPIAKKLMERGQGFSRHDLAQLLLESKTILSEIVPLLIRMQLEDQIEVSVSPFHHPILPLLINSDSAYESMSNARLPSPPVTLLEDAAWQVFAAIDYWKALSGSKPNGMWPSEGSISSKSLILQAAAGVKWTASDQAVLKASLGDRWTPYAHLLPYKVQTEHGSIALLFRDHELSDAIGFRYATWNADDAVDDFMEKLHSRQSLVDTMPPAMKALAVVNVILDGENCWEYYPDNGRKFIELLFARIKNDKTLNAVTCSEAATQGAVPLLSLQAGSWINADFDIWIGSTIKNHAWSLLAKARTLIEQNGNTPEMLDRIHALEASDYFWWYDDHHHAKHKTSFDAAFREGLQGIFNYYGVEVPSELLQPLYHLETQKKDERTAYPVLYSETSTMHSADTILREVLLETSGNWQRIEFHFARKPEDCEWVQVSIKDRHGLERLYRFQSDEILHRSQLHDEGVEPITPTAAAVYLHTSNEWHLAIQEQRKSGVVVDAAICLKELVQD